MNQKILKSIGAVPAHFTPALIAHALVYSLSFGAGWAVSSVKHAHHPGDCPWPKLSTFILRCRQAGLSPDSAFLEAQHWVQDHVPGELMDIDGIRAICEIQVKGPGQK